jgi:hypothetical protein
MPLSDAGTADHGIKVAMLPASAAQTMSVAMAMDG